MHVGFPLLLIPLAIYNIIAFLMPEVSFGAPLIKLALMSGAEWQVTLSDILVALGILLLLFEVIKGARPGAKYLTDHLLSLIVFGAAAAEFVLWPKFGTSTYFLLTAALAGRFPDRHCAAHRGAARWPQPLPQFPGRAPEKPSRRWPSRIPSPRLCRPSRPRPPAAASVAESVLLDHPGSRAPHAGTPSRDAVRRKSQSPGSAAAASGVAAVAGLLRASRSQCGRLAVEKTIWSLI